MSTSTTSISATKGEKGKSKYAALNINNLYKGNSIEPQTKTVAPKHGMQSLGKVPSARRAPQPVNLPSLKSESGAGTGQEANPPSAPSSQNPVGWTGTGADTNSATSNKQQPTQSQSPQPAVVAPTPSTSGPAPLVPGSNGTGPRQPVTQTGRPPTDQVTAFLDRKFQQDFPSLTADTNPTRTEVSSLPAKKAGPAPGVPPVAAAPVQGPAGPPGAEVPRQESPQPLQYGPGPSLRPQTEGSWVQGGRGPATQIPPNSIGPGNGDGLAGPGAGAIPPGPGGPGSMPGVTGGQRGGPTPGHPQAVGQGPPPPHALRSVMPPFMFRGGQVPPGASGGYPGGYQPGSRGPTAGGPGGKYPPPHAQDPRSQRQGPPRMANQGDAELYPRPIIKEEDLRRMDEISGDDGWAAMQDEPDYERKLFDDEDEDKDKKSAIAANISAVNLRVEEEPKVERDGKWADNIQAQGRTISLPSSQNAATQGGRQAYQNRPLQPPSQPLSNSRALSVDSHEDEYWREQRRQQKDEENKAAQRAKERREEEERRFEQTKQGDRNLSRDIQRDPVDSNRSSSSSGRDRDNRDRERDRDIRDRERDRDNRDRERDRDRHDDDKYDRRPIQRAGGGDRYDYFSRNLPSQSQIPPRFLKQRQHQMAPIGRSDEDSRPHSQPPKEIRLPARDRDRDERGPSDRDRDRDRDRVMYNDSRGDRNREWRDHERDSRDSEPVHSGYKRSYDNKDRPLENWGRDRDRDRDLDKRPHHPLRSNVESAQTSSRSGDWSEKDGSNSKRKEVNADVETDVKDDRERPNSRDSRSSNRETSVSKDDVKEKSGSLPYPITTEIVSWADEPADDEAPLASVLQSRTFGEDGRLQQHPSRGGSHQLHPPVPIPRDKLEAEVNRESKSNFVPLRRLQGANQPSQVSGTGAQSNLNAQYIESDPDKKNRPTEVVENVWASRSKTREQQQQQQQQEQSKVEEKENREEKKATSSSLPDKMSNQQHHDVAIDKSKADKGDEYSDHDAPNELDRNRKGVGKDVRGSRTAGSGPSGSRAGGPAKNTAGSHSRQRGGRSRGYDDYYGEEESGTHYKNQDASEDRYKSLDARKSKSPIEEDREDPHARSRTEEQRNRNSGGGYRNRRGYEDEELRGKEQQRPPRFQQLDDSKLSGTAGAREKSNKTGQNLSQQTSQDSSGVETWETHSEHSGGDPASGASRFNRRGRGGNERRSGLTGNRTDRGGKADHGNQADYQDRHKDSEVTETGSKDTGAEHEREDRKFKETKPATGGAVGGGDRFKNDKGRSAASAAQSKGHSEDVAEPKRARKDEGQPRKDRDDRRFQRPAKTSDRFDSRPKNNLPPRLARLTETNRHKHSKAEGESTESGPNMPTNKDNTPPPQLSNPWDKSATAGTSSNGNTGSLSILTSDVDRLSTQTAALIIDDATVDRDEEKPILDGTTPPVQTIIFENTNFKSSSTAAAAVSLGSTDLKGGKCTPPGQPQQQLAKAGVKVQQPQPDNQKSSTASNLKSDSSLQMSVAPPAGFNHTSQAHHSGGLQLPVGSKMSVGNRGPPMHHHNVMSAGVQSPISPSTAELNMKIASVKKVWDREMPSMPTVLEHYEDASGTSTSNSSAPGAYPPPFDTEASGVMCAPTGDAGDGIYSHSSASPLQQQQHQQQQQMQQHQQQQQMAQHQLAQQQAKLDVSSVTNVCKVKPQQQNAMTMSGQISSSPTFSNNAVPVCNASTSAPTAPGALGTGPLSYHQYSGMPAVPSPPAMVFGSAAAQQIPAQPGVYQHFLDNSQFSLLQALNPSQSVRSQFSQYIGGLSPSMGQLSSLSSLNNPATAPFGQQNILFQQPPPPSPAAPPTGPTPGPGAPGPAPPVPMSDMYQSSVSTQYRLQSHGHGPFGQSQHNAAAPMLISGSNSLGMKSSSYGSIGQPNYGSIGTKTGSPYQQQPSGHQHSQVYYPFDPSQPVLNLSQVNQMAGQSYLQSSQLLQQRTAPPPVQAIQPLPPSSFYSAGLPGTGAGSNQTGFYQPTGAPNLQHQVQVPPAAPGPFSMPGFASQVNLQGFPSRSAQQQQPPSQQQLNQISMGRYRNGPSLPSQGPGNLSGLQYAKATPSPSGASPAPNMQPSSGQYNMGGGHMDSMGASTQNTADLSHKIDNGHSHVGPSTSPKSRHKAHHQQQPHQQCQQQQPPQQLQQQSSQQQQQQQPLPQQMNKFAGSSSSSGAYPGPPAVIRSPGFPSVRTGPPPPPGSSTNNSISSIISSGGTTGSTNSSNNNTPRYPTPIQRPTTVNQNSNSMSQMVIASGPPGGPGLGVRPRAPNPHPARIPGTGTAPGQPQVKNTGVPSSVPLSVSQPFSTPSSATTIASSASTHPNESKSTPVAVGTSSEGDQQRKGSSPPDASDSKANPASAGAPSNAASEIAEKESSTAKVDSVSK